LEISFRAYFGDVQMRDWKLEISGPGLLEVEQEIRNRELEAELGVEEEWMLDPEPETQENERRWVTHPERGPPESPDLSQDPEEWERQFAEYGRKYDEWEAAYAPIRSSQLQRDIEDIPPVEDGNGVKGGVMSAPEEDAPPVEDESRVGKGVISVSWVAGLVWVIEKEGWCELVERALNLEGKNWRLKKPGPG
jgi:hypothetical protein